MQGPRGEDPDRFETDDAAPGSGGRWRRWVRRLGLDEMGDSTFVAALVLAAGLVAGGLGAVMFLESADHLKHEGVHLSEEANRLPSARLRIVEAHAQVAGGSLSEVRMAVSLGHAAGRIDLSLLGVSWGQEGPETALRWAALATAGNFTLEVLRDADGSLGGDAPVLNEGDLVEIVLPGGPLDGYGQLVGVFLFEDEARARFALQVPTPLPASGLVRLGP